MSFNKVLTSILTVIIVAVGGFFGYKYVSGLTTPPTKQEVQQSKSTDSPSATSSIEPDDGTSIEVNPDQITSQVLSSKELNDRINDLRTKLQNNVNVIDILASDQDDITVWTKKDESKSVQDQVQSWSNLTKLAAVIKERQYSDEQLKAASDKIMSKAEDWKEKYSAKIADSEPFDVSNDYVLVYFDQIPEQTEIKQKLASDMESLTGVKVRVNDVKNRTPEMVETPKGDKSASPTATSSDDSTSESGLTDSAPTDSPTVSQ